MKAQVKAIVASAVVIALCLAAVGGVTYSWFSDTEQSEITVNAAEIDLKLDNVSGTLKSYGLNDNTLAVGKFPIGGTISMGATTSTLDTTTYRITVDQMAPGDSAVLTFTGTLKNTIRTSITTSASITENGISYTGTMLTASTPVCTITDGGNNVNDLNDIPATSTEKDVIVTTTIALDKLAGNDYQNRQFVIELTVTAIQMNYDDTTTVTISAPGEATSISYRGEASGPTVTIPANQFNQNDNVSLTVKTADAVQATNDYAFLITSDSTPVAAIDLSLTVNGDSKSTFTSPVTVQVPVPEGLSMSDLTVKYINDSGVVTSEVITIVSYSDGILTFQTTHFSKYVVLEDKVIVAYNRDTGVRYSDLNEACSSATSGQTVVMLQDLSNTTYNGATESINLAAGIILDGNGHSISGNMALYCQPAGATILNMNFIGMVVYP